MLGRWYDDDHAEGKEMELYFHIPFCVKKCFYCDFLSAPADRATMERYMEALLAETVGSAFSYGEYTVSSLFIGGGTPSVVPAECIRRLMAAAGQNYRLAWDAEITIEVNPGTVTEEQLSGYRAAGINRLSIGLQSADNRELAAIGRIHTWEQFLDTYGEARRAGFQNVNVDIMSTLPGQTLSGYRNTLECVLSLEPPPEHISAYSLILEEGTLLFEQYRKGELELPDEDTDREMYQMTKKLLARRGYRRYEISNYAREGCECRHNCGYWTRKNYVGFGLGAASLVQNVRFQNGRNLRAYLENPMGCREDVQHLSLKEQMEEFMFLGLRMTDGVDPEEFRRLFGCGMEEVYGEVIRKNIRDGLLTETSDSAGKGEQILQNKRSETDISGNRLALTEKGLDVSNYVMAQFLL